MECSGGVGAATYSRVEAVELGCHCGRVSGAADACARGQTQMATREKWTRVTETIGARGQEEEAATARTESVGYSSPVDARRRAPARRLREGESAPGEQ